jgi:hypothetical protein
VLEGWIDHGQMHQGYFLPLTLKAQSELMTSQQQHYCLVRVEEVDYQEPLPRKNGWRYTGPDGRPYRQQVTFETGFRVHLPWEPPFTTACGQQWFNAIEPGGDATLQPFLPWASLAMQEGRVHPEDEAAWRFAFIDVEGGGKGEYHISQADSTWRTFITWVQQREHIAVEAEIVTERPAPYRELSIASFGNLPVRYEPATDFGKEWKALLPVGASLAILIADAWRDRQLVLFNKPGRRQRFGFRDMDEQTGTLLPLPARGRGTPQESPCNALTGMVYFCNLFTVLLQEDFSASLLQRWITGEVPLPELTALHACKWLALTSAQIIVWHHHGTGAHQIGATSSSKSDMRPRVLHLGIREGCMYRLLIDGP